MIRSRNTAEHYRWGTGCDGWILTPGKDLLIIEERMPPATAETRHAHDHARQFFYVLSGRLTMETGGQTVTLAPGEGIEIPPGTPHQARNDGSADAGFLVISAPTSRGDRTDLP